jgi:hypothetical protein
LPNPFFQATFEGLFQTPRPSEPLLRPSKMPFSQAQMQRIRSPGAVNMSKNLGPQENYQMHPNASKYC